MWTRDSAEFDCWCRPGENATFSRTEIHSDIYHLVACDLRDTAQLSLKLDACGVDRQLPTALIAECVLVYMSAEQSTALVKWIADNFAQVFFVNYEQVSHVIIMSASFHFFLSIFNG